MNWMQQNTNHPARWVVLAAVFAGGIIVGGAGYRYLIEPGTGTARVVEKHEGGYTFINPLLECDSAQESIGDPELRPFRKGAQAYADEVVRKKLATSVSIYFRDLSNGPAFGVNHYERYTLASLLKVPLMIAYLKAAEADPALLKKKLVYDGKQDLNDIKYFKGTKAIEPGKRYAIEDLIEMMVTYSDNNAMALLFNHMDPASREKVYADLGLFDPADPTPNLMSVKDYSSCFRILFNSSYLRRDLSEQALRYLAFPDFRAGIIGGIPPGIIVSQKFGERSFENVKELHDCGIVYYPNMPYLLCVMTKGTDFASLSETIAGISRLVYAHVEANQLRRTDAVR